MYCDVEVDGEGGVLDCWWYEEGGAIIRRNNHSREENWLGNMEWSGDEGSEEVMHELQDFVGCRSGLDGGILPEGRQSAGCHLVF